MKEKSEVLIKFNNLIEGEVFNLVGCKVILTREDILSLGKSLFKEPLVYKEFMDYLFEKVCNKGIEAIYCEESGGIFIKIISGVLANRLKVPLFFNISELCIKSNFGLLNYKFLLISDSSSNIKNSLDNLKKLDIRWTYLFFDNILGVKDGNKFFREFKGLEIK